MDDEKMNELMSESLSKGTAEIVEQVIEKPQNKSVLDKKKPLSREERTQEEKRERIRTFLRERHRDKLYFPQEEIPEGMEYRWIRESCRERNDLSRIALMSKKGWTPVPANRHPNFLSETTWMTAESSQKPDVIRVDGLILCERSAEYGQIEREVLEADNEQALKAVRWTTDEIDEKDRKTFINRTVYESHSGIS